MSSLFSESTIQELEGVRKGIMKAGIWILIGSVVLGAVFILVGNQSNSEIIAKVAGTMLLAALAMMISVNNFRRLADNDAVVGTFALVGLISNLVWVTLWITICWNPGWYFDGLRISGLAKAATMFSYLSLLGLLGSNIMAIYEGEKRGIIRPLKITATTCLTYEMIYSAIMTLSDYNFSSDLNMRLGMLAGFAGFVWIVIWIAAACISRGERRREETVRRQDQAEKAQKYEDAVIKSATVLGADAEAKQKESELRAEIEEKVRREMMEEEVRKKVKQEQGEGNDKADVPPMPGA